MLEIEIEYKIATESKFFHDDSQELNSNQELTLKNPRIVETNSNTNNIYQKYNKKKHQHKKKKFGQFHYA